MYRFKCPKCGEFYYGCVELERVIDPFCDACGVQLIDQTTRTNFERITESPEALAEFIHRAIDLEEDKYCKSLPECDQALKTGADIPQEKCMQCLIDWLNQPEV